MIQRKKKILFLQLSLLILGIIIIFATYLNNENSSDKKILLKSTEEKITKKLEDNNKENTNSNTFFNIEYSGLDFSGNRFILESKEATTISTNSELVNLKGVKAVFYFKDGTILIVNSNLGQYNSRTLDMKFSEDVIATYNDNVLNADNAEYTNSLGILIISNKVKIYSTEGDLLADKLTFDVKNQILEIDSFNENKINANIKSK
tara:strand:+ start:1118 stop:1732 length:615 start_codon:yes stop_codon:yes gene_type:complete